MESKRLLIDHSPGMTWVMVRILSSMGQMRFSTSGATAWSLKTDAVSQPHLARSIGPVSRWPVQRLPAFPWLEWQRIQTAAPPQLLKNRTPI